MRQAESNNQITEAINRSDLPRKVKLVLFALLSFRNHKTGKCNPSIISISDRLGAHPSTAQRGIAAAEKLGILSVKRSPGGYAKNDLSPNEYWVCVQAIKDHERGSKLRPVADCNGSQNDTPQGSQIASTGVANCAERGSKLLSKPTFEPTTEPSVIVGSNHRPTFQAPDFHEEGFVIASIMRVTKQPISSSDRAALADIQLTLEELPTPRIDGKEQPWAIVFDRAVQYAIAKIGRVGPVAIAKYAVKPAISAQENGRWPGTKQAINAPTVAPTTGKRITTLVTRFGPPD